MDSEGSEIALPENRGPGLDRRTVLKRAAAAGAPGSSGLPGSKGGDGGVPGGNPGVTPSNFLYGAGGGGSSNLNAGGGSGVAGAVFVKCHP